MKALVFGGHGQKTWSEVPDPELIDATDAIVRIETTTICGTDLHILKGDVPETTPGRILGHEGIGIVEAVGDAVSVVCPGDRVLLSCISSCGRCTFCRDKRYGQCLGGGGWVLGHTIDGTQAQRLRVPFVDTSTHVLPQGVSDASTALLSDILPTSYEVGAVNAALSPGHTVAIVGAGPIGLAAVATTRLFTPSLVIVVDPIAARRDIAKQLGADLVFDPSTEDVGARIREVTDGLGVDAALEAVGIPATFESAVDLVRPGGHVANIGVHGAPATLHLEAQWSRDITITTGLVDTWSIPELLTLVRAGHLEPHRLVTHDFALDDIVQAYETFADAATTGALKVLLHA